MAAPQLPTDQFPEELVTAYETALTRLQEDPALSGADIGYVWVDGRRTNTVAVRLHLLAARPADLELATWTRHAQLGQSTTVVLRADYRRRVPRKRNEERTRFLYQPPADPIQPGVSVSHENSSGGTLGLVVVLKETGQACALSNAHVLAPTLAKPGDWVIQPGRYWGGTASKPVDLIGRLYDSFSDIDGDAAIAAIETQRRVDLAQLGSNVVVAATRFANLGDRVEKIGVATGKTCGFVDGIGRYRLSDSPGALMDGFRIVPGSAGEPCNREISSEGDSGAVWYDADSSTGIGLHVGGDMSVADYRRQPAIACHLPRVLDRLNVAISCHAR